ncbi:hypothetical protein K1X76_10800 [bacterium]|nr:hypothetical protein [bacterium]
MKTLNKILVIAGLLLITLNVNAHEGEKHDEGMNHEKPGVEKTITGQMIDMACYFKHDSKGPDHKQCARECAQKGLPMAILSDDGKIYQIMGSGHDELKTVNTAFLDYVEEKVTVIGQVYEKNGTNIIVISKIKKAS